MANDQDQLMNASPNTTVEITITPPRLKIDFATIIGLTMALSLIGGALFFGGSVGAFFNIPAAFIVIGGTIAVTSIAYTSEDLAKAWVIIKSSVFYRVRDPATIALQMMDLAVLSKQKGNLALAQQEAQLANDPYIALAMQYIADGYKTEDIVQILSHDMDALIDRHKKGASIVRRAAEVAPAMGLIGTLVGLVQMLTKLNDPSSIGPAMAVALLTTFYVALLGTIFLSPLAAKLERNASHDMMMKDLILTAALSISKQESPRKLETVLNAALPPNAKIKYFK